MIVSSASHVGWFWLILFRSSTSRVDFVDEDAVRVATFREFRSCRVSSFLRGSPITVRYTNQWSMLRCLEAEVSGASAGCATTCVECAMCGKYYFSRSRAQIGCTSFFCALHEKWKTSLNNRITKCSLRMIKVKFDCEGCHNTASIIFSR